MKSVPPRGSGWVSSLFVFTDRPTRYRAVVLTSSDHNMLFARLFEWANRSGSEQQYETSNHGF